MIRSRIVVVCVLATAFVAAFGLTMGLRSVGGEVPAAAGATAGSNSTVRGGMPYKLGMDPLVGGERTSLARASALVPFHVYTPDGPGDPGVLKDVWVGGPRPTARQVALYYSSGILVIESPVKGRSLAELPGVVREYAGGSIGRVHGIRALILSQRRDGEDNPGSVTLVLGGVQVAVLGYQPPSVLERIADSLV